MDPLLRSILFKSLGTAALSAGMGFGGWQGNVTGGFIGFCGGIMTSFPLWRYKRREMESFYPNSLSGLKLLIENAKSFYATSNLDFQEWLSWQQIFYLIIQGKRKIKDGRNFNFKRIFILKKADNYYNSLAAANHVWSIHEYLNLTPCLRVKTSEINCDEIKVKIPKELDFAIIELPSQSNTCKVVILPRKNKLSHQANVETYWSEDHQLINNLTELHIPSNIQPNSVQFYVDIYNIIENKCNGDFSEILQLT